MPPQEAREVTLEDVQESFCQYSEAERGFIMAQAELLSGPVDRNSIAAKSALVIGQLLAYLEAFRAFRHKDARYTQRAFGARSTGAAEIFMEKLHRTIDRASAAEEAYRLETFILRILILADRMDGL
jgi:hypothetical protein